MSVSGGWQFQIEKGDYLWIPWNEDENNNINLCTNSKLRSSKLTVKVSGRENSRVRKFEEDLIRISWCFHFKEIIGVGIALKRQHQKIGDGN